MTAYASGRTAIDASAAATPTSATIAAVSVTRPNRVASAAGSSASSPKPPPATRSSAGPSTAVSSHRRPARAAPARSAPRRRRAAFRRGRASGARSRRAMSAAGGERRRDRAEALADAEREHAGDGVTVVGDDLPADGVRAAAQPGRSGTTSTRSCPASRWARPAEDGASRGVDGAGPARRPDGVVEEQADVGGRGREHGAVPRLRRRHRHGPRREQRDPSTSRPCPGTPRASTTATARPSCGR